MPLSSLRRPQINAAQLDLFATLFAPPPPLEVVPDPVPTFEVQTENPAETLAPTEAPEQQVIAECEPFVIDLPDEVKPSRDFRIITEHRIGEGSLSDKARENIAAIRTLKTIEAESRETTEDEKAILARYVGWGGMANVFNRYQYGNLSGTADEIRELLTNEEYLAAQASTPNAHYTSPMVITAMWEALRHLGVGPGVKVLEPSMGVGHFFGLMPDDLQGGQRTGVELDSITARIAKQLYPDATIFAKGFEETPLPDNYMDVAVGNVPFGDYAVHDPSMKHGMTRAIHDYFFAKSLDKVRPGGIHARPPVDAACV